ncbi:MAG: hypothetical protein QF357_11835, partial [Dehalococcoidia bacterium]|nr:hypothetical protein [Dehalococcoidia bacterium]
MTSGGGAVGVGAGDEIVGSGRRVEEGLEIGAGVEVAVMAMTGPAVLARSAGLVGEAGAGRVVSGSAAVVPV